jgi:hypothetical protein
VTWQPGRDKVSELLTAAELEQVTPDHRVARLLLDDAGRHLATAATGLSSGDLSGAYQLAYDALRKSAASLLAVQGLRATSRGGHIALQEATRAQFGSTFKAFRSFGRFVTGHHARPGPRAHDGGATWTERSASPLPSQAVLDFVTPRSGSRL